MTESPEFQVLSLDGGGIRGVFAAAVLAAIEEDCGVRLSSHFDLIAGTSTGGLLALALGMGIPPSQIVEFYKEHGPRIFSNRWLLRGGLHWVARKYPSDLLARSLEEVFSGRVFGQSGSRLVIPAFNIDNNDVYVFRTPHLERLRRDFRVPAWHVAMATTAAPTYFAAFRMADGPRLIDGGIWANNPAMVALVEGTGALSVPLQKIRMLSVGTVSAVRRYKEALNWSGKVRWANHVSNLILDATAIGVSNQVRFLLGDRYLRLNPHAGEADVRLDDPAAIPALIARARAYSRTYMPLIESAFLGHTSSPYKPLHPIVARP
jgi:uncharacterized protein